MFIIATSVRHHAAPLTASRRLPRLVLCLLLILIAVPIETSAKKKSKQGVKIITLEKGDCQAGKAGRGDKLQVHYVGKLKDGTVFDDGTEKVGRPMEMVLGASQVVQGWHIGLDGICLGEKRRLVVPPKYGYGEAGNPPTVPGGATLMFDVELVILNGQSAFVAAAEEGEAAMGVGGYCDSCHRVVEGFYEEWTRVMMEQRGAIHQRSGGNEPPAVTYNDDTEAMVQGFCDSNAVTGGELAGSVAVGCREIFKGYKREIVGKFLTETVTWEMMPRKKDEICREMVGACGSQPTLNAPPPSECGRCRAAMDALRFDLRTQGEVRRAKGLARQVWDTLDYICMKMHYRVQKAGKTQELCDDVVDEFGAAIVKQAEAGTGWADISDLVCGEWGDYCSEDEQRPRDEL